MIEERGQKGSRGFMGFLIDVCSHPNGSRVYLLPALSFVESCPHLFNVCSPISSFGFILVPLHDIPNIYIYCASTNTITRGINLDHLSTDHSSMQGLSLELHAMIAMQYLHHVQLNTLGSKPRVLHEDFLPSVFICLIACT